MREITVPARPEELNQVLAFVNEELSGRGCSPRDLMQIEIAVEELYINIASYAYEPGREGTATIRCEAGGDPLQLIIQLLDQGRPYDPLEKPDPDISAGVQERQIGGLGIFMAKKIMDLISYSYKDGKNILTLKKKLSC